MQREPDDPPDKPVSKITIIKKSPPATTPMVQPELEIPLLTTVTDPSIRQREFAESVDQCTTCGTSFKPYKHSKGYSRSCHKCLANSRSHEKTRRPRGQRVDERCKSRRAEWKEINADKTTEYYTGFREKQKLTLGMDEYHNLQAKQAHTWRQHNPDKVIKSQQNQVASSTRRLSSLKHQAIKKGAKWGLTDDYALLVITYPCFYCNLKIPGVCNSLDRVDNEGDYEPRNVVASCKYCNYIKKTMTVGNFMALIEHILVYHQKIQGSLHPELNIDSKNVRYNTYKARALNKLRVLFELTPAQFAEIIAQKCYLCGRENTTTHKNGIDRIDNRTGYVMDNCAPCCGRCNIFKRDIENFNIFIALLEQIHSFRAKIFCDLLIMQVLQNHEWFYKIRHTPIYDKYDEQVSTDPESAIKKALQRTTEETTIMKRNPRKKTSSELATISESRKQSKRETQQTRLNDPLHVRISSLQNACKTHIANIQKYEAVGNLDMVTALIIKLQQCHEELNELLKSRSEITPSAN